MYFAIRDFGEVHIKEVNGSLENKFEAFNEIKIIKIKIEGEVKVYILLFDEVTNAKSLIMAHGGKYLEDKLTISDNVDDREYSLSGELYTMNAEGNEDVINIVAERCKFVEFPMIDELLKVNNSEITQFITCLEVMKNSEGNYIDLSSIKGDK